MESTQSHQTFNMAMKYLCRLCAKEDVFSKDLLLENNKGVLQMIKDFIQIIVNGNDNLPTRICLNCEEKMVTFQLFVLECYKVQELLQQMTTGNKNPPIKIEFSTTDAEAVIKSEVKCEMSAEMAAEEIVSALHSEQTLLSEVIYENDYDDDVADDDVADDDVDNDVDDYTDDITIATLKKMKQKTKPPTDSTALNEILKSPNVKVKDLVKFVCVVCDEKLKSWSCLRVHYIKKHKSEPIVLCMCGFEIRSKSVLYKHVTDHKLESKKLRKDNTNDDTQEDIKYSNLNVRDFVKFKCHECAKVCSSWYSLKAHCDEKHGTSPVVQCSCGITLKSKSVLYKHIHDHKNPNILSCDKCPKVSKTIAALNKHKMRHVPKSERKFCCSGCDKIFRTRDALKSHEKSHIPIQDRKIYHCEICNLKFTTRSSAASHKKVVHEKIKGYVCDLCGYACGTNGELRQHRAIHSDDKPFVCNKCSKPFKTYSNLKTHMDTHEDTAYECYICRRILNSRRTLRKHLLVHDDKCRHICSYCNKPFKRRQTLKVHMYTHTGDKPLTCKWCDERFAYASTLRSHRLRNHPDKMVHHNVSHNAYSSYVSSGEKYIKEDVTTDIVKNTTLLQRPAFQASMDERSNKVHTSDKPLTCKWCDERFAYASTLQSHRLRCHPDKMAQQPHDAYSSYVSVGENYIKDDVAAVSVHVHPSNKNDVEAM